MKIESESALIEVITQASERIHGPLTDREQAQGYAERDRILAGGKITCANCLTKIGRENVALFGIYSPDEPDPVLPWCVCRKCFSASIVDVPSTRRLQRRIEHFIRTKLALRERVN